MSPSTELLQRVSRLAPLAEILAKVEAFAPVGAREMDPAAAVGATVAADIAAPTMVPHRQTALRDGWAVASESILDAGPYAPVLLSPPPTWIETGQPMPAGTDAVLPVDAVAITKTGAEAQISATPGESTMLAGTDAAQGAVLRHAGQRFRPIDVAVARAAGVGSISVRAPRVKIFSASVPTRSRDDTISPVIARAIEAEGCIAQVAQAATLESALVDRGSDAIVTIGGTGAGKRDAAVNTLARIGVVELHGLGISPGETGALGLVERRPVLMLPGRLDAALAVFLVAGRALLAQLAGASEIPFGMTARLTKKITSTVGLAEVVLVRRTGDGVEPLGNGMFPLRALAQADGWILVAPQSEGLAAGSAVEVRALP